MSNNSIYRVIVKSTGSLQPGRGCTNWSNDVLYCGDDLKNARIAFLKSLPSDFSGGYGNSYRKTIIEELEAEPENIESEEADEVEV